jgi:N-acetylneuraminic acid mutarotase
MMKFIYKNNLIGQIYYPIKMLSQPHCHSVSWKRINMPKELPHIRTHNGALYKDDLYTFGGWNENRFFNHLIQYSPITQHWKFVVANNTPPDERSNHSCTVENDMLVIFGGFNGSRMNNEVYFYSFLDNMWIYPKKASYLPEERDSHSACVHNGAVYIFGGRGWDSYGRKTVYFNDLHKLTVTSDSIKWKQVKYTGYTPPPRLLHSSTVFQNKIYVFGGRHEQDRLNDLCCYDLETNVFKLIEVDDAPTPRTSRSLCLYQNSLILFSGFDIYGYTNDTWQFDLIRQRWKELQQDRPRPEPRCAHLTIADEKNQYLMVFGGEKTDSASLNDVCILELGLSAFNAKGWRYSLLRQVNYLDVDIVFSE